MDGEGNHNWIGLRNRSTTLLDAVQWQCNTILNEQKPIQNNPSPCLRNTITTPARQKANMKGENPQQNISPKRGSEQRNCYNFSSLKMETKHQY